MACGKIRRKESRVGFSLLPASNWAPPAFWRVDPNSDITSSTVGSTMGSSMIHSQADGIGTDVDEAVAVIEQFHSATSSGRSSAPSNARPLPRQATENVSIYSIIVTFDPTFPAQSLRRSFLTLRQTVSAPMSMNQVPVVEWCAS